MPGRSRMSRFGAIFLGAVVLLVPNGVFGADLSGIVQTHDGAPAGAGWRVVVNGLDVPSATVALTDDSGSFQLTGLGEGRSTVTVLAPPEEGVVSDPRAGRLVRLVDNHTTTIELTLNPAESSAPTFNFTFYRGEYWNDQPSESLSTGVQLLEQGAVGNIDMELAAGGGTISGRVLRDVGNNGIAGLIVAAFGIDSSVFSFDRTDADGYYRITGVPADEFIVTAGIVFSDSLSMLVGEYYNNSWTMPTSIVIVTEGSDTPEIDFWLGEGGAISGRVTAESGGEGLGGVSIKGFEATIGLQFITLTDDTGNYILRGLPPGSWRVEANSGDNFVGEYWNNKTDFETADVIVVSAGPPVTNVNLALATGGSITGVITDQNSGQPLADLFISAERDGDPLTRIAQTDPTGTYLVQGLPSGMYRVHAVEIGEYWDNRTSRETADLIPVSLGVMTSGKNFQGTLGASNCGSSSEDVSTIRGVVVDQNQNPLSEATIGLYVNAFGGGLREYDDATTDENGVYEFTCVQPGNYFINCQVPFSTYVSEWYDDQGEMKPDIVRAIANQVTDNIDFALAVGGTIGGRVTAAGGVPLPGVEVSVKNRTTGDDAAEITDADGRYAISGGKYGGLPAGTYTVWTEGRSTADPSLVPVVLSRFDAAASAIGGVVLAWTTSHEFHHAGFHVERAAAPDAAPVRLTNELLSGGPEYRYVDAGAPDGSNWYWLLAVDRHGRSERLGPVAVDVGPVPASRLLGPLVNPSVRTASIRWQTARDGRVQLRLFDAAGRWVRTLVDEIRPAGAGAAYWDGRSADGRDVAGGLYFLRFDTEDETQTGRLMLVR